MLKFIFYAFLLYLVFRVASFWRKIGRTDSPPASHPSGSPSGNMVKDEICQTYLPQENALREVIDGEERYFCSRECRRKALEERTRSR
jgi:YHS domain-containing protein